MNPSQPNYTTELDRIFTSMKESIRIKGLQTPLTKQEYDSAVSRYEDKAIKAIQAIIDTKVREALIHRIKHLTTDEGPEYIYDYETLQSPEDIIAELTEEKH